MSRILDARSWQVLVAAIAAVLVLAACGESGGPGGPGGPVGAVDSVTIDQAGPVELDVGGTTDLTATVAADEGVATTVEWTASSDAVSLETLDGNTVRVTGVQDGGTASVTATSVGDPNVSDSVSVVVGEVEELLVTSAEDYDPYSLEGRAPDAPIEGTLRQVLSTAPSGSVITFADGIDEITLFGVDTETVAGAASGYADAHLIIRDDVTIRDAEGVTINAVTAFREGDPGDPITYHSRVLFVPEGVNATLEGLTLQGGGFIVNGGGIANMGNLTLRDVTVTDNRAYQLGGGIYNVGTLTVEDSSISGNTAATFPEEQGAAVDIRGDFDTGDEENADLVVPAAGGYGGAIYNEGDVSIVNSTIEGNDANFSGGAIYDLGTSFSVSGSTIEGNVADPTGEASPNYGGGAYTAGAFDATDTDFLNNDAGGLGGGLYLDAAGTADLNGVLFDGNIADLGGGIFHQHDGDDSNLSPSDPLAATDLVTFGTNTAREGGMSGPNYYESDTTAAGLVGQSAGDALPRIGDVTFDR